MCLCVYCVYVPVCVLCMYLCVLCVCACVCIVCMYLYVYCVYVLVCVLCYIPVCTVQVINCAGKAVGDGVEWPVKEDCSKFALTVRWEALTL